jgi:hypothetical protein
MKRQVAIDPVDLAFVDAHRQDAAQILQLSFDFARADAQFSTMPEWETHKGSSAFATGSPDLAQFVKLEDNTELQRREAIKEILCERSPVARLKAWHRLSTTWHELFPM